MYSLGKYVVKGHFQSKIILCRLLAKIRNESRFQFQQWSMSLYVGWLGRNKFAFITEQYSN